MIKCSVRVCFEFTLTVSVKPISIFDLSRLIYNSFLIGSILPVSHRCVHATLLNGENGYREGADLEWVVKFQNIAFFCFFLDSFFTTLESYLLDNHVRLHDAVVGIIPHILGETTPLKDH